MTAAKRIYRLEAQLTHPEIEPGKWKFLGTYATKQRALSQVPTSRQLYAEGDVGSVHRVINTITGEIYPAE